MGKVLYGSAAKCYNYIENLGSTITNLYNYSYLKIMEGKDLISEIEKFYKEKKEELKGKTKFCFKEKGVMGVINFQKTDLSLGEVISLGFRFIEEVGLEETAIIPFNETLINYLEYLDVDYEVNEKMEDFQIVGQNNEVLVQGFGGKDYLGFTFNIEEIGTRLLKEDSKFFERESLDVKIEAQSEEEIIVGIRILQDIRWSDISAEINSELESKMTIKVKEEELSKGIIIVKDNVTQEEIKVDENEILDYVISNL